LSKTELETSWLDSGRILGDGHSRTGGIALEDIARIGTVRNFDVRNRSRTCP
jgi:hypothetical protein